MNAIQSKFKKDEHIKLCIGEYNEHLKQARMTLITIQHVLTMKHNLKLEIHQIQDQVEKYNVNVKK
jgi:hypothetical protein